MRLGVIEFGQPLPDTAPLLGTIREGGIDVITKLDEPQSIRDEAQRLHRADCDGVVIFLGTGVAADDVAEALLYIHTPVLLVGRPGQADVDKPVQSDAATKIALALAVTRDVLSPPDATPEAVVAWLGENSKIHRQRGVEAAHKLYGTRLYAGAPRVDDGLIWLRQFGILVRDLPKPDDARPDDIHAVGGDMTDALTERLLRLVSGSEDVQSVTAEKLSEGAPAAADIVTLARITSESESAGHIHFRCVLFKGAATEDGLYSVGIGPFEIARKSGANGDFYAAVGDHVGALRAALAALDIPTVVLRDD